jgi:hypothetical protein
MFIWWITATPNPLKSKADEYFTKVKVGSVYNSTLAYFRCHSAQFLARNPATFIAVIARTLVLALKTVRDDKKKGGAEHIL